jgi:hypothetical protein
VVRLPVLRIIYRESLNNAIAFSGSLQRGVWYEVCTSVYYNYYTVVKKNVRTTMAVICSVARVDASNTIEQKSVHCSYT